MGRKTKQLLGALANAGQNQELGPLIESMNKWSSRHDEQENQRRELEKKVADLLDIVSGRAVVDSFGQKRTSSCVTH